MILNPNGGKSDSGNRREPISDRPSKIVNGIRIWEEEEILETNANSDDIYKYGVDGTIRYYFDGSTNILYKLQYAGKLLYLYKDSGDGWSSGVKMSSQGISTYGKFSFCAFQNKLYFWSERMEASYAEYDLLNITKPPTIHMIASLNGGSSFPQLVPSNYDIACFMFESDPNSLYLLPYSYSDYNSIHATLYQVDVTNETAITKSNDGNFAWFAPNNCIYSINDYIYSWRIGLPSNGTYYFKSVYCAKKDLSPKGSWIDFDKHYSDYFWRYNPLNKTLFVINYKSYNDSDKGIYVVEMPLIEKAKPKLSVKYTYQDDAKESYSTYSMEHGLISRDLLYIIPLTMIYKNAQNEIRRIIRCFKTASNVTITRVLKGDMVYPMGKVINLLDGKVLNEDNREPFEITENSFICTQDWGTIVQ